jgi:hypothetical protein
MLVKIFRDNDIHKLSRDINEWITLAIENGFDIIIKSVTQSQDQDEVTLIILYSVEEILGQ